MKPTESDYLHHLIDKFDLRSLGEGDEIAGANLLATMAITLANLAPPGSGLLTPQNRVIPVGCNVIANGAHVSEMIREEIIAPVEYYQNNLLSHIGRLARKHEEQQKLPMRQRKHHWEIRTDTQTSIGESSFFSLITCDSTNHSVLIEEDKSWSDALADPPSKDFFDLVREPRVFLNAASPSALHSQLHGIHDGHGFVSMALNKTSDLAGFRQVCQALIDGTYSFGPSGESTRARLLFRDPIDILSEALRQGGDNNSLLRRVIWLVSGKAGPELPQQSSMNAKAVGLTDLTARFRNTAHTIFIHRMKLTSRDPITDKYKFTETQARWMTFLRSMEGSLPGISGTARNLLASLVFGIQRLIYCMPCPKQFQCSVPEIEAFARFLVRRMANARATSLFSSEKAKKLQWKQKILTHLSGADFDNRDACRQLRLPADICQPLLLEMAAEGSLRRSGKKWQCVIGAHQVGAESLPSPLEV